MAMLSSTEIYGARLLRENKAEEESLEDLLTSLRTTSIPNLAGTGIREIDALWRKRGIGSPLAVTGRGMALLYHLISNMLTALSGAVVVLDLTSRFSPSHLSCDDELLSHLHVYFPTKDNLRVTLEELDHYMLYGEHLSKGREWVATILVGGGDIDTGRRGDPSISIGWKGWLKVKRDEVNAFGDGIAVGEIWGERDQRQVVIDERGWSAGCEEGVLRWT